MVSFELATYHLRSGTRMTSVSQRRRPRRGAATGCVGFGVGCHSPRLSVGNWHGFRESSWDSMRYPTRAASRRQLGDGSVSLAGRADHAIALGIVASLVGAGGDGSHEGAKEPARE